MKVNGNNILTIARLEKSVLDVLERYIDGFILVSNISEPICMTF